MKKLIVMLVVLCLSFNVYASKHLPASTSKNIVSILKESPALSKFWGGVGSAALIFILACGNMSCGMGTPYVGENLYFIRDGLAYGAEVTEYLPNNRYRVKVNGTNKTTTISKSEIEGKRARSWFYTSDPSVVLAGNRAGIKYRHGVLKRHYDNDYVEIRITHETMHNDNVIELHEPYIIFVDKDASLEEGGFVYGDFY